MIVLRTYSAKEEAAKRIAQILAKNKIKIAESQKRSVEAIRKLDSPSKTITKLQEDILNRRYN